MEAKLRLVGDLVNDSVPVDNDEVCTADLLSHFFMSRCGSFRNFARKLS